MLKDEAVKFFGSHREIALKLMISDAAVSQWRKIIPERSALKLERITKGKLKYNPDFYRKNT
ncbi:Cro/CI family transcriptional regulator [Arsenophonus nasoniae]|uniref:Cro/CI family transcriptional regulator n=1 Tax=Arsenophonus nasoniae TaxID=638 RepID=A0AA95K835_9GAMM|nr:Cro/CI family transcriptional regulator [Arsenophonus nasoniae]WGL95988.1 Cro/CI family transcriptional regulator [Arsenophonus nasoniae]